VGFSRDPGILPEEFVPATVPGAVQLDWARARRWPLPEYAPLKFTASDSVVVATDYAWMEDVFWLYRTRLDFKRPHRDQRLFLVIGGVDYKWEVRLNGRTLHRYEGMFTPFEADLTRRAAPGDWLEVLVWPAPRWRRLPAENALPLHFCKPPFSYGWDFHPRLVPLGIWQDACLEIRPACHLKSAETFYELSDKLDRAETRLDVTLNQAGPGRLRWRVFDPTGKRVVDRETRLRGTRIVLRASIERPQLWWPNGQGAASLYRSDIELLDRKGSRMDARTARLGFRRIRLVPHESNWNDPDIAGFPVTRNKPPITFEVNGRRIFAKGSNWVSPDLFPGRIRDRTLRRLLNFARASHFNLLRCWGGSPVPNDSFYELCDERGLMVWQEFPLACGRYEGTPAYLKVLHRESRSIIRRLRSRPSLALWCGGNELFNAWSRMTDQDLALRLLDRNCYDLDRARPFLMTSPLFGWAHGGYQFRLANGREVFDYFAKSRCTGYTEFGVPAPAGVDLLRRIIPAEELFPPRPGTQWEARHAFGAWSAAKEVWLDLACAEHYFGPAKSLEQVVKRGQLLQSEGLKSIFEEARRQKPVCSIALNWCFNEPWPAAANNSLVSWPASPKPGLKAVAAALRPTLASLRIPKFSWKAGETFTGELFLLNDAPRAIPAGIIEVYLVNGRAEQLLLAWEHQGTAAGANLRGPGLRCKLRGLGASLFVVALRVRDHPEWNSAYTLHCACSDRRR
jgi:beta-mannosidase